MCSFKYLFETIKTVLTENGNYRINFSVKSFFQNFLFLTFKRMLKTRSFGKLCLVILEIATRGRLISERVVVCNIGCQQIVVTASDMKKS